MQIPGEVWDFEFLRGDPSLLEVPGKIQKTERREAELGFAFICKVLP